MKKKLFLFKILSFSGIITANASLLSCSKNISYAFCPIKEFYSQTETQNIEIQIIDSNIDKVQVVILNSSSSFIYVQNNQIAVEDNSAIASICFNPLCSNDPMNVSFDLKLTYLDKQDKIIASEYINGFNIHFPGFYEERKDRVIMLKGESPNVILEGVYHGTFTFYSLSVPPQSKVDVELYDPKNIVTLKDTVARVERDPTPETQRWKIMVDVELPISLRDTELFNLTIKLKFINSYHNYQTTTFSNLVLKYEKGNQKILTEDYMDIQNGVFLGLKPSASFIRTFEDFEEIVIPEGVTKITANALRYPTDTGQYISVEYQKIRKLTLPKSLQIVEENAFYCLTNLFEIDVNWDSEDTFPPWFLGTQNIFLPESFKVKYGYLWTNFKQLDSPLFLAYMQTFGLPETWIYSNKSLVTPADSFIYEDKELDNEKVRTIVGIQPKYRNILWKYGIIRIPDDVIAIDPYVFEDAFSNIPYRKNNDVDNLWTRRLILGRGLRKVGAFAFANAGIGGPVWIPSCLYESTDEIKQPFADDVFFNIGAYSIVVSETYFYNQENVKIIFEETPHIINIPNRFAYIQPQLRSYAHVDELILPLFSNTIGNDAFNFPNYNNSIKLPECLEKIGKNAFEQNNISGELIIPSRVKEIGEGAFKLNSISKLIFNTANKDIESIKYDEEKGSWEYKWTYSALSTVGEYAFGGPDTKQQLTELDISVYSAENCGEDVGIPGWLSSGVHIFDNIWNTPESGVNNVYVSQDLYTKYFDQLKSTLQKLGMPTDKWQLVIKT